MIARLRREMSAAGDREKAAAMRAYMKSAMPFHGLSSAQVDAICKSVFAKEPASCAAWKRTVLELWRGATHREERYAAIWLLRDRRHRGCITLDLMPMLEELIVTGAWWDVVDAVSHVVGDLLRDHPAEMKALMRNWSTDPDMWKRRVSIICQLGFKNSTDLDLLYANIGANLDDGEFFIRKAIGWALRQYAWTDPVEVARYVREHGGRLSGLSKREALKNI